ncbi:MAG: homoserine dehydrogenase [Synergistaceae bacterium]|nr:homoserine dehydrogenase [Synergistaceae bacterium]MBQ7069041.1 homoserine dehydrogenase [Synergistaceae bacterium]
MINIAILGLGTVGGGVAEVVEKNQNEIKKSLGDNLHVKYILDIRDIPGVVKDINVIVNDPDVKVICETMGGKEPAYTYTHLALEHGISVCTSNKELVDAHGVELSEIARAHNCSYLFEASVGGGIPILRSLRESCGHEKISYIAGILNGTCNYILTNMKAGKDFDTALKEAQEKGFAERNPAADVEGHDTARKIAILASLVSGKKFSYEQVNCEGITKITQDDFVEAERNKMSIKLLGVYDAENNSVNVAPYLIPENHILYGVNDVFNGIFVKGNQIDNLMFYGRGAGKLPTASAVVSDVIECAKNIGRNVNNNFVDLPLAEVNKIPENNSGFKFRVLN